MENGGRNISQLQSKVQAVLSLLDQMYPDARTELRFENPYQLLVAAVLSAQTTDRQVNRITEHFFAAYPDPQALAAASLPEVEEKIQSCGLFHTKAKNLIALTQQLVERHGGQVPPSREELMKLPGVGRKTANVVLSNAFGIPALAVDTHVFRVSHRLGWAQSPNVRETEAELCRLIPSSRWGKVHHQLIYHGRRVCQAQRPKCNDCSLLPYCPYGSSLATSVPNRAHANQEAKG